MPKNLHQFDSPTRTKKAVSDPHPAVIAAGTIGPLGRVPWPGRKRPYSPFEKSYTELFFSRLLKHYNETHHQFTEQPLDLWKGGTGNG